MIMFCTYVIAGIVGFTLGANFGLPGIFLSIPIGFLIGLGGAYLSSKSPY